MNEDIDYKNLFEGLQHENEQLREKIAKIKLAPMLSISWYQIFKVVSDWRFILGYMVGLVAGILCFFGGYHHGTA